MKGTNMGDKRTWRSSLFALTLLLALETVSSISTQKKIQDTDTSIQAVPSELRRSVSEAIALERRALLGANDSQNCSSSEEGRGGPPCPPSKYRSPSGECNNVRHRPWGRKGDIFLRLLAPNYVDGISTPHTSPPLPEPSLVVRAASQLTEPAEHDYVNSLLAAWGQMLVDDLLATANHRDKDCKSQECEYVRSAPTRDIDSCGFDHREQMNLATGFLDGSALYGTAEKELRSLRLYDAGKLELSACRKCNDGSPTAPLYRSLLAEHNRIAGDLYALNPFWDDVTLFLESRRAVAALIQHITYNEFLPVLLGEVGMSKADLALSRLGFWRGYSSAVRAGVYNEMVAIAPIFDAMINDDLLNRTVSISDLLKYPAHRTSRFDLSAAWGLMRARDHGAPSYMKVLKLCDPIASVQGYADFEKLGFDRAQQEMMASMYRNAEDVELLLAGSLEKPATGAVVGPTLACLLSLQFANLKKSDRFWYENDLPPSSFLPERLAAIRKVSLAGLLCSANDELTEIQPKAFVSEDPYLNAAQQCSQHTRLDMSQWKDTSGALSAEQVSADMLNAALEKAKQEMAERKRLEYMLWEVNGGVDPKSPAGTAASFSKANKHALKLANSSLFFEFATNEILNSINNGNRRKRQIFDTNILGFSPSGDFADALQSVDVSGFLAGSLGPSIEPQCDDNGPCDPDSPFRTYTGHCNNLRNPNLGKSLTTFARLLPPVYEDGVSRPRINAVTGTPLPSPRTVSTVIHPDISNLHNRYTLMVMQFAQFLDHELTMTPIHKGFHESIPDCRSCDSPRTVHPECNPIPIPRGDHYYPDLNVTSGERLCFPFMRSLPGQQQLGPREQVNQNTPFLDGSVIYGENPCIVRKLRGFNGRLNSTIHPVRGKDLLPRSDQHPECKAPSGYCFIAGDGRASEQPGLTAIHTVFMREHNRLVEGLRGVNPHWDADLLFEHTRRIVAAQISHIVYNEFLPRLLSWNAVNLYGLKLQPSGYYKEYSPTCNPAIVTEFASAAFRVGHSLLRPHLPRLSPNYQPLDPPILLRDGFFKPDMFLRPSMVEELIRGMVSTPMETLDQFITGEVTNHLFEDRRIPFSGIDLVALNIQRSRDHGIPSYNNYRALCNLKRASTWEDLSREIPDEVIARLKRIYPTVDDVDLFPGGMSERPLQGGLVGPTFACIIAIQFRQLRKCDRFWYETDDPVRRFTEPQLNEIRKTTLSKVLCENFDIQSDMQRAAFDLPSNFLNPRVPCASLPQIDLSAWRESSAQGCLIAGRNVAVGESAFPSPCTSCICTSEGAQCASLRITDCAQLMREWPREAVLRDDVCAAQCGALAAASGLPESLAPPPPRATRQRGLGFKLPDLSAFIAK